MSSHVTAAIAFKDEDAVLYNEKDQFRTCLRDPYAKKTQIPDCVEIEFNKMFQHQLCPDFQDVAGPFADRLYQCMMPLQFNLILATIVARAQMIVHY